MSRESSPNRRGCSDRPSTGDRLILIPFHEDPLLRAAGEILDCYAGSLPDLSACQILVAEDSCAPQLRAQLLEEAARRGFDALLGPRIDRLEQWLNRVSPLQRSVLSRPAQELVLAEALRAAKPIYADTDPWLLSDQLLSLFDELTRYGVSLAPDADAFQAELQQGYGVPRAGEPLQQEAAMLHTLWHAWRAQLDGDGLLDPATAYQLQLEACGAPEGTVWVVGLTQLLPAEARWLRRLLDRDRARVILHGHTGPQGYHPGAPITELFERLGAAPPGLARRTEDGLGRFVDALFADSGDNLKVRARRFASLYEKDPVGSRIRLLRASDSEHEAQSVALQIRRWLLNGNQPLALVTEDRRIARRVRALLEASGIELDDAGGWALSTTSAAAIVERWLETLEEDFACSPLLDVLKSPFVAFSARDSHLAHVRHLEQDIILNENIARGLDRYRHQIDVRAQRLPDWSEPTRQGLQQMLDHLERAAAPLMPLLTGSHPAAHHITALITSLNTLGAGESLARDPAGRQLLDAIDDLHQAAGAHPVQLTWTEFRNWLGRHLERASFRVPTAPSPVKLLTLEQTRLQRFAGVVVAGCTRENLPGEPAGTVFFNQRVRAELGLPIWPQLGSRKLHGFCRVIQSAPRVLLTCHREQDGEPVAASPWVDLLDVFYRNAWGTGLEDHELESLASHPNARPATPDTAALPGRTQCPAPRLAASIQPKTWSVYSHQRLIDCPYRFYASDVLRLKPQDEIREFLSKSDYGSLVHRILQAFNSRVPGLPGPWSGPLSRADYEPARDLLTRISEAVFARAVGENFQARSWLKQWLNILPHYLSWEIERRQEWQPHDIEARADRQITPHLRIGGRIDRIDRCADAVALVDYKTGRPPRPEDVLCGEAVQLPSYALMIDPPVERLDYLELARDKVTTRTCAEGEALHELLEQMAERLVRLSESLRGQAPLPAWGTPDVCGYCEFAGVCRRESWSGAESIDV
jgi:ATP-dependent helicase/nuclease subunit B